MIQTFPFMCLFLLAAGLSLLGLPGYGTHPLDTPIPSDQRAAKLGPVVL